MLKWTLDSIKFLTMLKLTLDSTFIASPWICTICSMIHLIGKRTLCSMTSFQQVHEIGFKFPWKWVQEFAWIIGEQKQLSLVSLWRCMTFESVFVTALLLTHLTVPSELLKTFGFDVVANPFWRSELGLPHSDKEDITHKTKSTFFS